TQGSPETLSAAWSGPWAYDRRRKRKWQGKNLEPESHGNTDFSRIFLSMPTQHSVCPLDCPDACGVLVEIEDGRATKLRGNPAHPVTRGFLCGKVAQYLDRQYSPERVLYPMKRVGPKGDGRFERISWDEALDTIAAKLTEASREYGSESILPYS